MIMAEDSGALKACSTGRTLFDDFHAQLTDPFRVAKSHRDKLGDLSALGFVNLEPPKQACSDAIGKHLPGHFGKAVERRVMASFDYLRILRTVIDEVGLDRLRNMVDSQDAHLTEAVRRFQGLPAGKSILAAFSVVEDQSITLDQKELDNFIHEVSARESLTEDQIRREARRRADTGLNAKGGNLDDAVHDGIDVLAQILVLMRREGLKPAVMDAGLQEWIVKYFASRPSAERTFGGAAGNEAEILRAMGLPVVLHIPYHHQSQANLAPDCARRLVFGPNGPMRPSPSLKLGNPTDARRFSFVLQVTPETNEHARIIGPQFRHPDGTVDQPIRADRVILRFPNPRTDRLVVWDKLKVTWGGRTVEIDRKSLTAFLVNDWPYLPAFQHEPHVDASDNTLHVELASSAEMKLFAGEIPVALLGGFQGLGGDSYYGSKDLRDLLQDALIEQLQVLVSMGAKLQFELSSVGSGKVVSGLKTVFAAAGLKDVSLNREELTQITSESGPFFVSPRPTVADTPISIYWRAAGLLKALDVDTVYVHDAELDILVKRIVSVEPCDVDAKLRPHRQAMLLAKAAVPADLLRRGGSTSSWDLVLSAESLGALLLFADDYSRLVAPSDKTRRKSVQDAIMAQGYYYQAPEDMGVVVAPGVIVDVTGRVTLSGAGDRNFAVHGAGEVLF
jgi:ADP-dependent phosphofructokinase/glucokinase